MNIEPIAYIHDRSVVFEPAFRDVNALRGIEGFSHLWLIWGRADAGARAQANGLELTAVELEGLERVRGKGVALNVGGAGAGEIPEDAPVYDVKPYIAYTDAHDDERL